MDNIKDDQYYTRKIMTDLSFIHEHMKGLSYDMFAGDEVLQDSMMFRLIQVSENSKKLTDRFREEKSDVPWQDVFGLRNRIVHEYGAIDLTIIYDTLMKDIPVLMQKMSM